MSSKRISIVGESKLYAVRNEIMLSKLGHNGNKSYGFFSIYSCKRVRQKYRQYYLRGKMGREAKVVDFRFRKLFIHYARISYW